MSELAGIGEHINSSWASLGPLHTASLICISQRLVYRNNDQSRNLRVYGLALDLFPWLLSRMDHSYLDSGMIENFNLQCN